MIIVVNIIVGHGNVVLDSYHRLPNNIKVPQIPEAISVLFRLVWLERFAVQTHRRTHSAQIPRRTLF